MSDEKSEQQTGTVLWYDRNGFGRVRADRVAEYFLRAPLEFADNSPFHIEAGDRISFRTKEGFFTKLYDLKLLNRAPTTDHANAT